METVRLLVVRLASGNKQLTTSKTDSERVLDHPIPSHEFFSLILGLFLNLSASASAKPGNETEKLALLHFKSQITDDPLGVLAARNQPLQFCQWTGVTCGHKNQRVTSVSLFNHNLAGSISAHIGNLTFLHSSISKAFQSIWHRFSCLKHGDICSYGVLLLEMFTGKKPTDEQFKDDLNIATFLKGDYWIDCRNCRPKSIF